MSVKQCSKCGTTFQCMNEQMGCWCEELYLDIDTLNKLKKDYNNCLCPECLATFSGKASIETK